MIKGSIIVKPQVFAAAVKWAAKFVAAKPIEPIQGGIVLSVADGNLELSTFSENVTARATLPVDGDAAGLVIVSARLLAELVGTFPTKPVTISGDDEMVEITVGRWRGTLPAMDESTFPAMMTAPEPIGRAHGDALASLIEKTAVAASKDTSKRIALTCIHLSFADGMVTALATDSYRAARVTAAFERRPEEAGDEPITALVPGTVLDVAHALAGPDEVWIGWDQHTLSLTSATRSIVLRQMGEKYDSAAFTHLFAVAAALPEHAVVKVADLLEPLKRAAVMLDKDGPIRVKFGADMISLATAASDVKRDSDEEVDAQYAGPEHTLGFNPKYFAEALSSAPGDTVHITLTTERVTGVLLTVPGNTEWQHILMPLKLS